MIDDIIKLEHSVPIALAPVRALMGTHTHTPTETFSAVVMVVYTECFSVFLFVSCVKTTYVHVCVCVYWVTFR